LRLISEQFHIWQNIFLLKNSFGYEILDKAHYLYQREFINFVKKKIYVGYFCSMLTEPFVNYAAPAPGKNIDSTSAALAPVTT
jgi:hypothetical protein